MVAYLQKPEGSEPFHQIVDFLNVSHIKYALIGNLKIYVSLIQQFWGTATARTTDDGEVEIIASIDGEVKTITEASLRRHLKLEDSDAWEQFSSNIATDMIGSLMYLTISRPDIMFAVCACARFQVTPKTSHLLSVKRIFRYLKGKPTLGLWYSRDSPFELVAYTDSDYAGATLDRKSTIGGYLLTKGFDAGRFQYLVSSIGMLNP
ncbi:hypothetical protein Tco_0580732 [Tanacetum coccineum]